MNYKKLTKEQLEKYENKKLTSKEIMQMEESGFMIPLMVKLYNLEESKLDFTEDTLKDMLRFAIEKEYYEKAALLHTYLESITPGN
jgi:hypothetical protein